MAYGDKRDYPKIDIYRKLDRGGMEYICSTTWARTCREAREVICARHGYAESEIRAYFAKR